MCQECAKETGYQPTRGGDASDPPQGGSGGSGATAQAARIEALEEALRSLLATGRKGGPILEHLEARRRARTLLSTTEPDHV